MGTILLLYAINNLKIFGLTVSIPAMEILYELKLLVSTIKFVNSI